MRYTPHVLVRCKYVTRCSLLPSSSTIRLQSVCTLSCNVAAVPLDSEVSGHGRCTYFTLPSCSVYIAAVDVVPQWTPRLGVPATRFEVACNLGARHSFRCPTTIVRPFCVADEHCRPMGLPLPMAAWRFLSQLSNGSCGKPCLHCGDAQALQGSKFHKERWRLCVVVLAGVQTLIEFSFLYH